MKRREFVALLGAGPASSPFAVRAQQTIAPPVIIRQDWLDRRKESIIEPEVPIIDPHHHLYERPTVRYLFPEILLDINSGHNIVATVFVQAHSMYRANGPVELRPVGEVEFVNGIAAMSASGTYGKARVCHGIVGQADLTMGSRVEPVLAALLRAGGDRFRGIRHITSWDPDESIRNPDYPSPPGLLADRSFREGFAVLGRLGLSFDAMLYHPQIDELANLAGAFSDVRIVLNHIGGPLGIGAYRSKRNEVFSSWSTSIKALAAHQNVYIKIGGFGQRYYGLNFNEQTDQPSSETLARAFRPYFDTCIAAFGPSRSMFESNFPVDKVSYSYPVFWNACKLIARGASKTEKADLFAETAARFYRLNPID
jgi:predicted TIM-barrel fold metal-dependent hydrolase